MRLGAAGGVGCPNLRQVERTLDQRLPVPAGVAEEHADLARLNALRRAAALPPHADRFRALLEKSLDPLRGSSIEHQHSIRVPERLNHVSPQVVTHGIRIPVRPTQ